MVTRWSYRPLVVAVKAATTSVVRTGAGEET
jgi:hypothetical protein